MPQDARICVAQIGAAHGIRGEVRLKAFTAEPDAITRYGPLESEDGTRQFELLSLRPGSGHFLARFKDVEDRNAAEALRTVRLYVAREKLPEAAENEFYFTDLIGLTAVGFDNCVYGTIAAVQNFGAGDLLEIAPAAGGATVFLPFTKAAVPQIDIKGGRVLIDPPAGLFPDPAADDAASPPPLRGRSTPKVSGGG